MADPFSPDAFYGSAGDFALSALARAALEHLARACLAKRSPEASVAGAG